MIFIDLETEPTPNLEAFYLSNIKPNGTMKDPEKIAEDLAKKKLEARKQMSVDRDYAQIKLIGTLVDGHYESFTDLQKFVDWLDKIEYDDFVTFNGLKFDFPTLVRNLIRNKINISDKVRGWIKEANSRYHNNHVDLMERLCGYGDFKSLDTYAQIYLGASKKPIDFNTCTMEELDAHCEEDVRLTEALYDLFSPLMKLGAS